VSDQVSHPYKKKFTYAFYYYRPTHA
jgi:hypothetical protein